MSAIPESTALDATGSKQYTVEIRIDHIGTEESAREFARRITREHGGYLTAIFDEDWDEVDL